MELFKKTAWTIISILFICGCSTSIKKNKKIVFDDTDIRHAKLKIRLQHDGLSQAEFFRAFVTGYIEKDRDIIKFINQYKLD